MVTRAIPPCCRHAIVNGKDQLIIETSAGQRITLQESAPSVLIEDGNGNIVRLDSSGITITASTSVNVNASQVNLTAAMVNVNAGMATFSGVVKAETVMANAVITPGAGNIW